MSRYNFAGKIIWLTGASSGIGAALARALAGLGSTVYVSARNGDSLAQLAKSCPERIIPLPVDVSDESATFSAANEIMHQQGRLDVLIANAGICEYIDVAEIDLAAMRRVMDINFMGTANTVAAALPLLRVSKASRIALMASSSNYVGLPRAQAYGASKAAVNYLAASLRTDLAAEGIVVSVINPGFVDTPLTQKNDFPMPMQISAEEAAAAIIRGIEKETFDIHFPKRFTLMLKAMSLLPDSWLFALTAKLSRNRT